MTDSQAGASTSPDVKDKQNIEFDHAAVKSPLIVLPKGLCLLGRNINTEEIRRHTVIPHYLRTAMAEAVRSKGFVYEERRHKGTGEENSPDAPLLVFINSKSGGRLGPKLKNQLQDLLSQEQVFDLSSVKPEDFFQHGLHCLEELASFGDLCAQETRNRIRVLVAGGDGTVGWVLGSISNLPLEKCKQIPPVGVIPLGTGNDFARSFGWGGTFSFAWRSEVKKYLLKAVNSRISRLDSWLVVVKIMPGQNVGFPHAFKPQRQSSLWEEITQIDFHLSPISFHHSLSSWSFQFDA